jgi:hypothetical protein
LTRFIVELFGNWILPAPQTPDRLEAFSLRCNTCHLALNEYLLASIECLAMPHISGLGSNSHGSHVDGKNANDVKSAPNQHQAKAEDGDLLVLHFPTNS